MTRRWFITGCSTGRARALALAIAEAGQRVVATARKPEALEERPLRLPIGEDSWTAALTTTKQAHEALPAERPALANPS
jgi:NAD(P)-dependent dehydrogenase (short-subunit alcohol dehydrogenase family)